MQRMFVQVPMQTGYGGVTRVEVALPYCAALVADSGGKYYMEPKRLEDDTERRRYHRGPTLRSLVKLALACESAEQMGKKLRRRFERQQRRAGIARVLPQAEAELAERLDGLLDPVK
jgi:hypothetical protein